LEKLELNEYRTAFVDMKFSLEKFNEILAAIALHCRKSKPFCTKMASRAIGMIENRQDSFQWYLTI